MDTALNKLLKGVPFIDNRGRSGISGGGTAFERAWDEKQKALKEAKAKADKEAKKDSLIKQTTDIFPPDSGDSDSEDEQRKRLFEQLLGQPTEEVQNPFRSGELGHEEEEGGNLYGGLDYQPTTGELMDIRTDSERWKESYPEEPTPNIQNSSALNKLLKAVSDTPDDDEEDGELHNPGFYLSDSFLAEHYKKENPGEDWNSLPQESKDALRAAYMEQFKHIGNAHVNDALKRHQESNRKQDEAMRSKQDEAMQPEKTEEYEGGIYPAVGDPRYGEVTGGENLNPTTGELMDIKTDSERWEGIKPPKEFPPNIQNDSALNKLLKATNEFDEPFEPFNPDDTDSTWDEPFEPDAKFKFDSYGEQVGGSVDEANPQWDNHAQADANHSNAVEQGFAGRPPNIDEFHSQTGEFSGQPDSAYHVQDWAKKLQGQYGVPLLDANNEPITDIYIHHGMKVGDDPNSPSANGMPPITSQHVTEYLQAKTGKKNPFNQPQPPTLESSLDKLLKATEQEREERDKDLIEAIERQRRSGVSSRRYQDRYIIPKLARNEPIPAGTSLDVSDLPGDPGSFYREGGGTTYQGKEHKKEYILDPTQYLPMKPYNMDDATLHRNPDLDRTNIQNSSAVNKLLKAVDDYDEPEESSEEFWARENRERDERMLQSYMSDEGWDETDYEDITLDMVNNPLLRHDVHPPKPDKRKTRRGYYRRELDPKINPFMNMKEKAGIRTPEASAREGGYIEDPKYPDTEELMDIKTDSEKWREAYPYMTTPKQYDAMKFPDSIKRMLERMGEEKNLKRPKDTPQYGWSTPVPYIQNDSALNKLLKAVELEGGRLVQGVGTQYGIDPTDPIERVQQIDPDDYGPDKRYHQVDTSSQWGTPDLHSYGYGHEVPDLSGATVKPYWEQMNDLRSIEEEEQERQQAEEAGRKDTLPRYWQ